MKNRAFLGLVLAAVILSTLIGCDPTSSQTADNAMLEGGWLRNNGEERWTFRPNDTFTAETRTSVAAPWTTWMEGSYKYRDATGELILQSGGIVTLDMILNAGGTRFAQGVDAVTGGNTGTLVGTWVGRTVFPTLTHTRTWTFTPTTWSHRVLMVGAINLDKVATGALTGPSGGTFTTSGSTDHHTLDNGTYSYMVIGNGLTIAEDPIGGSDDDPVYFDKL